MSYGLPYMGSKRSICEKICPLFPPAENFYDLFGGGFSVTHCMIEHRSKDYKFFHFNEIREGVCDLIKDSIAGKYNYNIYKPEWVSRDDFFKSNDPLIRALWSFGNNWNGYLFGKEIEAYKKSLHMAVVFNIFDEMAEKTLGIKRFEENCPILTRRLFLRNRTLFLYGRVEQLQQLERLERLQQLQQLQQLERLQQLEFYNTSYENIKIKPNSVIYCDPPYKNSAKYSKEFNTEKFLDWADAQETPVYISEYNIEDPRFLCHRIFQKRSLLQKNKDKRKNKSEKLYINRAAVENLKRIKNNVLSNIHTEEKEEN